MANNKTTKTDLFKIDPRNIVVVENFNSRVDFGDIEELAGQIAKDGILNPIHVRRIKDSEQFTLVDGERRYRAVMYNIDQGLPVTMIPAIVMPQATKEEDLIRAQIQCNEGKNFNEYEYGVAFQKLRDLGYDNESIAALVGKKVWAVSACIAHLKRDQRVQELMKSGRITGVDVRHIYQAHKDEAEAVKTILALQEMADSEGKDKLALKNLKHLNEFQQNKAKKSSTEKKAAALLENDFTKTVTAMDTTAIKNGLNKLYFYLDKVPAERKKDLSIKVIREGLQNGKLIDEILGLNQSLREAE